MRKRFIKVSVICALALTSSTAFVGCADYDDDIKNLQEQIDGVTSKLDVSKEELTAAINSSVEALKTAVDKQVADLQALASGNAADIETLKTEIANKTTELQASIDGKADAATVESKFNELKGIIDELDQSVASSLDAAKTELGDKISALETEQGNLSAELDELKAQLDGNASQADVDALKNKIETLEGTLATTNDKLAQALNSLKAIEDAKFGEQIAALETRIASLETLEVTLKGYTDAEVSKLNATLSAKISTELDKVIAEMASDSTELANQIKTVDGKLANYITKNDPTFTDLVSRVQALENYKDDALQTALAGKASASDLANAVTRISTLEGKVSDLEAKFAENGDFATLKQNVADLGAEVEELEKDLKAMLSIMIQSIVYEPDYITSGSGVVSKILGFNTLQVADPTDPTESSKYKVVTENKTSVVRFRITPIAAAKDFAENYNIVFEGYKVTNTRAAANYLNAEYNEAKSDLERGVVAFTVSKNDVLASNSTYCLSARVTPKNANPEDGTQNLTEVASDYFLAAHKDVVVSNVQVVSSYTGTKELAWNSAEKYDMKEGFKLIGKNNAGNTVVDDMVTEFGIDPSVVSYALDGGDKAAFTIDNGVVGVADQNASSNIGKTATVDATVSLGGYKYLTNDMVTIKVIKAVVSYSHATIGNSWKDVAAASKATTIDLAPIANTFKMSVNDLKTLLASSMCTVSRVPAGVTVDRTNGLVVTIAQGTELSDAANIDITLKDNTGSTGTLAGTEYTITIPIAKTDYPTTGSLSQDMIFWNDQKTVQMATRFDNNTHVGDLIIEMDAKTLFDNFDDQITAIKANGGIVTMTTTGATTNANYSSTGSSTTTKFVVNKDSYDGTAIKLEVKVAYGSNVTTSTYDVSIADLAGNLVVNNSQITITSKTAPVALTGFKWTDKDGRLLWENGKVAAYGANTADVKYDFANNPFSVYAMSQPTFVIEDPNGLVEYTNGTVQLTAKGQDYTYSGEYKVTLKMTVAKPKWGELSGLTLNQSKTAYEVEVSVVVSLK